MKKTLTPAEHFGLKVIGQAKTPGIANFPPATYDVIKIINLPSPAGRSFMTNKWFRESNREPLFVVEQFGAIFTENK